jgi:hypothetical protein
VPGINDKGCGPLLLMAVRTREILAVRHAFLWINLR